MSCSGIITGAGLITPLGRGVERNWTALLAGEFIRDHARVPLSGTGSRVHQLATIAAREAIEQARWGHDLLNDPTMALVVGTSKGPVETWLTAPPSQFDYRPSILDANSLSFGLAGLTTGIVRELGFGSGPRTTLSAACA